VRLVLLAVFSFPLLAFAQQDFIAGANGTLTGMVEDEDGNMVPPQAAISATVTAQEVDGAITAQIDATGSCTGGLGLHLSLSAQYDVAANSFTGMYSDIPGAAPYKAIKFVNNGGLSWQANLSGSAPSDSGARAYDLTYAFDVPESAVIAAAEFPAESSYGGSLNNSPSVSIPLNIPEAGINQNLDIDMDFTGSWSANAVPQLDGSAIFTGSASGSFVSTNSPTISGTVPVVGAFSLPVSVDGSFGGTMFLVDESTVSFQGSWVANGGDQTFGGDISITIPFEDVSSFPFSVSGTCIPSEHMGPIRLKS